MTAEYETFHTLGGGTDRVLTGVRGPTVYAPELRPTAAADAAAPMETSPEQQLEQLQEPETLAKVLPAGGPLLGREMCPLCEHAPAEPRDNPFRSCRACGYRAP